MQEIWPQAKSLIFAQKYSLSHQSPSSVNEGEVDTGDDGIKVGRDEVARHILQVAKHLLQAREDVDYRQVDLHT